MELLQSYVLRSPERGDGAEELRPRLAEAQVYGDDEPRRGLRSWAPPLFRRQRQTLREDLPARRIAVGGRLALRPFENVARRLLPVDDQRTEGTEQCLEQVEARRRKNLVWLDAHAAPKQGNEARVRRVAHHDVPASIERHGEERLVLLEQDAERVPHLRHPRVVEARLAVERGIPRGRQHGVALPHGDLQ